MPLKHTANHLAAQGRNGDSMLMHVTPREVSGLQALAQHHGGSLTVNPQTGLPEANFLDDIGLGEVNKFVPAIAGAGLSFFSGGAIDPMTAAAMVGGLAGLSSGSLADGIQAGLGAYGGASLTGALGSMGGAANAKAAAQAADAGATGPLSGAAFSNAATAPDVGAGFDAATGSFGAAKDFLKDNKYAIGAAALPALMGSMEEDSGPTALRNKGYIRRYEKNPVTGALEQVEAVPVDDWGSRSAVSFGGVGDPVKYADGGAVKPDPFGGGYLVFNEATKKYDRVSADGTTTPAAALNSEGAPAVKFAAPPKRTPVMRDPNDTRTDSQKAYDYLMGKTGATNPMLFYHDQGVGTTGPADAVAPLDLNTRTGGRYVINKETGAYDWVPNAAAADAGLASLAAGQQGGGNTPSAGVSGQGFTGSTTDGSASTGLASMANSAAATLGNLGLTGLSNALASQVSPNYSHEGLNAPIGGDPNQGNEGMHSSDAPATSSNMGMGTAPGAEGAGNPSAPGEGIGGGHGEGGGAATGGQGGDASGGGDRGTRGGFADGGIMALASGGMGNLGGYSDGGRLLRGPGDGVSDSIPATIGKRQPARLADGEFVVPARIVSELGNGSTEAGAKQLYAMLARIQAGRAKTTGKNQVAKNSKAARHLPA